MRYIVTALVEYTVETSTDAEDEDIALAEATAVIETQLQKIGVSVGSVENVEPTD